MPAAFVTVNRNTNVAGPTGATNDGATTDDDDNATGGPDTCCHPYVRAPPEPAVLPVPVNVTDAPDATC